MQELEKILEEIDNLYVDETDFGIECNMENRSDVACDNCYECIKEACKNIIRKHTSDGWVSVEKDLPKNESEVWVVLESTYGTGYRTYSSARYLYFENYGEGHWCDEHYGYLEWDKYSDGRGGSSQYKVIAWQPIVPYRLERRDAVERESNNL